ncbi:MBG domain-containing protein [uncultured Hymenobacter sp.]|uniref:MBG domain-containing protein n=1 Tax=uncultured Hymenobacter sp. TaxID=170016 RepID=UPI0035C9681C
MTTPLLPTTGALLGKAYGFLLVLLLSLLGSPLASLAQTVTSDKDDYAPGEIAHISGSGWGADQQVHVEFKEEPDYPDFHIYDVNVDAAGNWQIDYSIEQRHLGVKFTVTAVGQQSGARTTAVFTDAQNTTTSLRSDNTSPTYGELVTFTITVIRSSGAAKDENTIVGSLALKVDGITVTTQSITGTVGSNIKAYATTTIAAGPHSVQAIFTGSEPTKNSGYNDSSSPILIQTVTRAPLTVTAQNKTKTYDGQAFSPFTAAITGFVNGETSGVVSGGTTYTGEGVAAVNYRVTPYTITPVVTGLSAANYSFSPANGTLTINRALATITLSNLTATYTGSSRSATITTNPAGLATTVTYAGSTTPPTAPGSYAVVAALNNANYTAPSATGTLVIAKASNTISFTAPADQTYAPNQTLNLSASATSTLPVSFAVVSGPASISGSVLTITGAGSVVVEATQGGSSNYAAATPVSQTFSVAKAPQTITFAALPDKTFTDADFAVSASASSSAGLPVSFAVSGNGSLVDGKVHLTGAGPVTVTASQAGDANYLAAASVPQTFAVAKASGTLALSNLTPTYTGAVLAATVSTAPVANLAGVSLTYTQNSATVAGPRNAGSYAVTATLTNDNYAAQPVSSTFTIAQAAADVTLGDLSQTYSGSAKAASATTTATGTSSFTYAYTLAGAPVAQPIDAGSYQVTATLVNDNYTGTAPGTLVINKAPATLTLGARTFDYDGTAKPVTVTSSPAGLSGASLTYEGVGTAPTNAGTYALSATLNNSNYEAPTVTGSLVISKASLTARADDARKTYGEANPVFSGVLTGVQSTDNITASYTSPATAASAAGAYPLVPALSDPDGKAGNYDVTLTSGELTIGQRTLTVTATGVDRVYDGGTTATVVLSDDRVGGDDLTISYARAKFANKAAANGKQVSVSGIAISGAAAGNYSFNPTATTTADIAPLATTASFTAADKGYDGDASAEVTGTAVAARLGSDEVALGYRSASFNDKNAASGKTVTLAGAALTGADAGNYELTSVGTATASITARSITGSFAVAPTKVYDRSAAAEVTSRSLSGVLPADADQVSLSGGTAAYADASAGDDKTVTLTGFALTGVARNNYTLTSVSTTTAAITRKDLTGSFTAASKVYDGNPSATVLTRSAAPLAGDVVTLTGGTATFGDKNKGANKNVTLSGASLSGAQADNYTLASVAVAQADIMPKAASVAPELATKIYGGSDPAFRGTLAGFLAAEDISASYSREAGETAGTYSISAVLSPAEALTNYTIAYNTATFTITPATPTLTAAAAASLVYSASPKAGSYTLTGVNATDLASETAELSYAGTAANGTSYGPVAAAPTSAGTYTITARFDGNPNYNAVTSDAVRFSILPAALTVSSADRSKVYGAALTAADFTGSLAGVQGSDNITASRTSPAGAAAAAGVTAPGAEYTIVATLSDPDGKLSNYSVRNPDGKLTVTKAALAVTAENKTKVYGATNPELTGTLTGVLNGDAITATYRTDATAATGVGSVPIVADFAATPAVLANYALSKTDGTLAITAKDLSIAATNQSKVYGQALALGATTSAADFTASGLVNGDAVSGVTLASAGAAAPAPVDDYDLTPSAATGTGLTNYAINYATAGQLRVTKAALTVTADEQRKAYGEANPALTASYAGFVNGDNAAKLGGTLAFATTATPTSAVGAYDVIPSGLTSANYAITFAKGTLTIGPKALTATAVAKTKVYGELDPFLTFELTNTGAGTPGALVAGDAFTGSLVRAPGKNVGPYPISQGTLALSDNYTLTYAGANLTITKRQLTVTATGISKVYDRTTTASVTLADDRVAADVLTASAGASFAEKTVGTGKPVAVSGIAITGQDAGNYTVNAATTTAADITALSTTAAFVAADKTYDGTTAATVSRRSVAATIAGDAVELSAGTAAFDTKNVGSSKTVTLAGALLAGSDAGNYQLTKVNTATAAITTKAATVTPALAGKVYGSTDPALTGTLAGFVAADNVTAAYGRTAGETVAGSPYTISATLSPAEALTNYTITYNTAAFSISSKTLTVRAVVATRQYSDPNPAFAVAYEGFRSGEGPGVLSGTLTYATVATPGNTLIGADARPGGAYSIVPGGLTSTNYALTFVPAPLTITKEATQVVYSGLEYFSTTNSAPSVANVEYISTFTDDADGSRGNITNALAAFTEGGVLDPVKYAVKANSPTDATVGTARTGTGIKKVNLSAGEVSAGGKTFELITSAQGDYYSGATTERTLITVAVPGQDYVNGGGSLVITQSGGTYAAPAASKMNFGFTMKWNKTGKNIQGQANIIFRKFEGGAWRTYQIKGTSINTLGTSSSASGNQGDFNTKANLTYTTEAGEAVSIGGNLDLSVQAFESTVSGAPHKIGVTLRSSLGELLFSSNWTGSKTEMQALKGGKISVRNTAAAALTASLRTQSAPLTDEPAVKAARTSNLLEIYPSPLTQDGTVHFATPLAGKVQVSLYNGVGALVATLHDAEVQAGRDYYLPLLVRQLESGVYFCRLIANGKVENRRIMVVK